MKQLSMLGESEEKDSSTNEMIDLFKNINPSYKQLFKNKTQRGALERLIKEHGEKKIRWCLEVIEKSFGQKYAPTITTPVQLENKGG